ncbi:MAG TPA: GTP-binding protein, partial [Candidatus Lokiarchaeia archaeon]|nr:GTP-binding protein [Candidatus Lokiarchaeia archaeon]
MIFIKVKNPEEIQELVLSTDYSIKRIFSIVAHIAHGKTTTSDFLLKRAGLLRPEDAGHLQAANFDEEEKARRITIFTHVVLLAFDCQGTQYIFQVNDTPGHISFTGEVSRALRGSDGAILVVDGLEGVMTQTETNIRLSVGEALCKPVLFVNKVDRLISELRLEPGEVFSRVDKIMKEVNMLIEKNQPKEMDWRCDFASNQVCVGSAKDGWGFTYELLKEGGFTPTVVFEKYAEGNIEWLRENLPLDEAILRMVVQHLPNPQEAMAYRIQKIWPGGDYESEFGKCLSTSDPNGPLCGMITKHIIDPKKGFRVTLIGRIFSGTLHAGEQIYLVNMKEKQRIKRLGVQELTDLLDMPAIPAGNLCSIDGFVCPAGETFISADMIGREDLPTFEKISYVCQPVVSRSIMPIDPTDLAKLGDVTKKWMMADPSASFHLNKEAGEYILSGVDLLQLEVITKRINEQVEIKTSEPIIVYRERVMEQSPEVYTKSSNGHNRIKMYIEPLDETVMALIRNGEITEQQDAKERGRVLKEKAGWDPKEGRK